jgi:ubiquinone/menaquinone biosynthesis C-methylase UbiE
MQASDWHARYLEQAQWTKLLRQYILNNLPIQPNWMVCEFGCGTGAVLQDLSGAFGHVVGLDRDLNVLAFQDTGKPYLVNANAYNPPFQANSFDLIVCHYFLLWLSDPLAVLRAARNMLKSGGYLAVFAEPDYASRRALPESMKKLAVLQNQSLTAQGANLKIGRNLGQLLTASGFTVLEYGSMKEANKHALLLSPSEKNVLRADWKFLNQRREAEITLEELESLWMDVPDRWYVPTYYALAQIKN